MGLKKVRRQKSEGWSADYRWLTLEVRPGAGGRARLLGCTRPAPRAAWSWVPCLAV